MSTVTRLRPAAEQLLTKRQLAAHLGKSPRWIEMRVREGMPSVAPTERYVQRRFRLADVEGWLAAGAGRPDRVDRVSQLEERVARLEATVQQLEGWADGDR